MPLKDLKESLYKRDTTVDEDRHLVSKYNPGVEEHSEHAQIEDQALSDGGKSVLKEKRAKVVKISAIIAAVAVVGALFVISGIVIKRSAFNADRVELAITGPDSLDSNNIARFSIEYENNNRSNLENAEVVIDFPQSFVPEENVNFKREGATRGRIAIGSIISDKKEAIEFQGKFFGTSDEISYISAKLIYTPENINGRYEKDVQKGVVVNSSPLRLDIISPIEAASGDVIEFNVEYNNQSIQSFQNARLQLEYPSGFRFISAQPDVSEGEGIWYLGNISSEQSGKVIIKGVLEGERGDERAFRAVVGYVQGDGSLVPYGESRSKVKVVSSPLSISQVMNDQSDTANVSASEDLRYTLEYKNDGDIGLRNVIVTFQLFGDIFDNARVNTGGGSYNTEKQLITWKASDIRELESLAPGESGIISFEVPVMKRVPVKSENDQHFTAHAIATIDSPDVPDRIGSTKIIGKDRMDFRLNTDMFLDIDIIEKNTQKEFREYNLKVGDEAIFEVRWNLTNLYNEASNVIASAYIPSTAQWIGVQNDEVPNVIFNDRTQKIEWQVGNVDNGVGVLTDSRELVFEVSVTPQVNQIDREIELLHSIELTGMDMFTDESLRVTHRHMKTSKVRE